MGTLYTTVGLSVAALITLIPKVGRASCGLFMQGVAGRANPSSTPVPCMQA